MMSGDRIEEAQDQLGEARRILDCAIGNYQRGLRWLDQDMKRSEGFMVWRDSGLYTQANLTQWNPKDDILTPCLHAVSLAEGVLSLIMDKEDGKAERYWEMLASKEHAELLKDMAAAYEQLRAVHLRYDDLRRQYELGGVDDELRRLSSS